MTANYDEKRNEQGSIQKLNECLFVITGLRASGNPDIKEAIDVLEQRIVAVKTNLDRREQ